ncbi:BTB/POZ protein [Rhizophagus irregularis DAOM 181602=DAOM 197198]|nr:BTB/POZ protein [Rhizophagus irregularis DAOM 181602=DAOM 197198]
MEDYKFLPNLSRNLLKILNDDEYYDVTVEVGKDPYVKVFRAHMVILIYRSPYLRRILSTNVKKNDGTLLNFKTYWKTRLLIQHEFSNHSFCWDDLLQLKDLISIPQYLVSNILK